MRWKSHRREAVIVRAGRERGSERLQFSDHTSRVRVLQARPFDELVVGQGARNENEETGQLRGHETRLNSGNHRQKQTCMKL